jgi:hypothetical protein
MTLHAQTLDLLNLSLISLLKVAALLETGIVVVDFGSCVRVLGELSDRFEEVFLLAHGGNVSWVVLGCLTSNMIRSSRE